MNKTLNTNRNSIIASSQKIYIPSSLEELILSNNQLISF